MAILDSSMRERGNERERESEREKLFTFLTCKGLFSLTRFNVQGSNSYLQLGNGISCVSYAGWNNSYI